MSLKGIDVSKHNGTVNWPALKSAGLNFAIIRCGFGDNSAEQDDKQYSYNVSECERLRIPYGIYLYSYADTELHLKSEIDHTLRLLKGHHPQYPVYFDAEDAKTLGQLSQRQVTDYIHEFCSTMNQHGFEAGYYANLDWYKNKLCPEQLKQYSFWYAHPGLSEPDVHCDMLQNGFGENGARFGYLATDTDICYANFFQSTAGHKKLELKYAPDNAVTVSDTTQTVTLQQGKSYQFRLTCNDGCPRVHSYNSAIADVTITDNKNRIDYFVTVTGKAKGNTRIGTGSKIFFAVKVV